MSDEETGIEVENLDTPEDVLQETEQAAEETPEPEKEAKEEIETPDLKAEKEADAALKADKAEGEESEEEETPEYKPNFKFKADKKEHEVPKLFQSLITDEKSEKEVKNLLLKAYGADAILEKAKRFETQISEVTSDRDKIKGGIDGLRKIYSDAVKHPSEGGNLLKLDQFFRKLNIPTQVILNYALAHVQLDQMPPEQRDAILARLNQEEKANALTMEREQLQGQNVDTARRLKQLELDQYLNRPDILVLSKQFEKATGNKDAFRNAVIRTGELAWHRQKVDLSPDQAAKLVIDEYGLKAPESPEPETPSQVSTGTEGSPKRQVVQRTNKVIPNVQGKGNLSPLKTKPRSIEDIKKLAERAARGEAV